VVWVVATVVVVGLLCWLGPDLTGSVATLEEALTRLAALAAAGCAVWAWAVTTATVALAVRGGARALVPGCPSGWRRMVLAACGVALVSGTLTPAQATDGPRGGGRDASVVAGLPLPDRPTGHRSRPTASPPPDQHVVVAPGDSLWSIAVERLGSGAAWQRLYAVNRAVVGADPDLIHPGQRLRLPVTGAGR